MTVANPSNSSTRNASDLSHEEVFEILANRRRRFVIHALKRANDPPDVSELSRYVTAWEMGVDPEDVPYEERHNVHSTLRRVHLPKLTEANVVTVDEDDVVRPAPALKDLDIYVEVLRGREIPWSLYYLGLAVLAGALLLAVRVGSPGFAALSFVDVGIFVATAFGISSVAHHAIGRRMRLGNTEKPPEVRRRRY
ncbi:transcriptional regulator [Halorubrum sp. E3]|nr:transcriptional regulator [Halorubrum sp. E3]OYR83468.1 transcriptional regulator [Halorubrum distributum]